MTPEEIDYENKKVDRHIKEGIEDDQVSCILCTWLKSRVITNRIHCKHPDGYLHRNSPKSRVGWHLYTLSEKERSDLKEKLPPSWGKAGKCEHLDMEGENDI